MTTSVLSEKYQVTIPAEIWKSMNLKPGQRLQITEVNGKIEIRLILTANQLIGFLKDTKPVEFEREKNDRFL
jgi:AbrB family looped-hinge helix DNA binding protein